MWFQQIDLFSASGKLCLKYVFYILLWLPIKPVMINKIFIHYSWSKLTLSMPLMRQSFWNKNKKLLLAVNGFFHLVEHKMGNELKECRWINAKMCISHILLSNWFIKALNVMEAQSKAVRVCWGRAQKEIYPYLSMFCCLAISTFATFSKKLNRRDI